MKKDLIKMIRYNDILIVLQGKEHNYIPISMIAQIKVVVGDEPKEGEEMSYKLMIMLLSGATPTIINGLDASSLTSSLNFIAAFFDSEPKEYNNFHSYIREIYGVKDND